MKKLEKIYKKTSTNSQVSIIEIDDRADGQRIDNFLFRIYKGVPKSHIYRILRSGEVRVNKRRVKAKYRLVRGDFIRKPPIQNQKKESKNLMHTDASSIFLSNFNILYEDDALIVIDKPIGVAVHGGSGITFGVIERMRRLHSHLKFLELVHRLDRETSGILMLAKKRKVLVALHKQIRENRIEKCYLTCAYGNWANNWGSRIAVNAPLFKYTNPNGERRVRVQDDGLASHTVFNLIKYWPGEGRSGVTFPESEIRNVSHHTSQYISSGYALIKVELKTGRTHQIRAHLTYLGLSIAGDQKYGNFSLNKKLARVHAKPYLKRMFLHAHRIRFLHPITENLLQIDSPLPRECQNFLEQLNTLT